MTTVAMVVPFAALAVWRGRALGDDLRGLVALLLVGAALVVTALLTHPLGAPAIALAYTATCAWTDALARRVYLPVSFFAATTVAVVDVLEGGMVEGALGAVALGGFGLLLHFGTRRRGFGFGDVTCWAIVGASFGVLHGVWIVAVGSIVGAVLVVALIALGVVDRSYRVPLALYTFVGTVAVMGALSAGVL
jgi:prepilin signal peptidase PulO-like enzyme (type II secretory pathway)